MEKVDRYPATVCCELARIAEHWQWAHWGRHSSFEKVQEDLELTFHLHMAAEAAGVRAGLPPMSEFPIGFRDETQALSPAAFVKRYAPGRSSAVVNANQSDSGRRAA